MLLWYSIKLSYYKARFTSSQVSPSTSLRFWPPVLNAFNQPTIISFRIGIISFRIGIISFRIGITSFKT